MKNKPVIDQDILSLCKELGVKSPADLVGRKIYFSYIHPSGRLGIIHFFSSIIKVETLKEDGRNMRIIISENDVDRYLCPSSDKKKWYVYSRTKDDTNSFSFFCCLEEIHIYKRKWNFFFWK